MQMYRYIFNTPEYIHSVVPVAATLQGCSGGNFTLACSVALLVGAIEGRCPTSDCISDIF